MDKALFERLTHSMAQMNEIIEGKDDLSPQEKAMLRLLNTRW